MAALDFPGSPSNGQTYTANGLSYTWDGTAWRKGSSDSGIPSGCILLWSGSVSNIPSGWYLCNGQNSTPDLRNRFVIGAHSDSGGEAKTTVTGSATQSGGSKDAYLVSHTHGAGTYSAQSAGAHTHTYSSATQTNRVDNDETHQYLYSNTTQDTGLSLIHI